MTLSYKAQALLAAAVRGDKLMDCDGELYIASWFGVGWWVYSAERDSKEYFVDSYQERCTCPVQRGVCKHLRAVRRNLEPVTVRMHTWGE